MTSPVAGTNIGFTFTQKVFHMEDDKVYGLAVLHDFNGGSKHHAVRDEVTQCFNTRRDRRAIRKQRNFVELEQNSPVWLVVKRRRVIVTPPPAPPPPPLSRVRWESGAPRQALINGFNLFELFKHESFVKNNDNAGDGDDQ